MTGEQVVEVVMCVVMAGICGGGWLRERHVKARRTRSLAIHEPPSNVELVDPATRLQGAVDQVRGGRWAS